MKWYKHSPDKWLAGTRGMSFEQKGLHADLISLYVDRDGDLPDDDTVLVRILCCHPQNWRRLKAELLKIQKLRVIEGKLVPNGGISTLKEAENFSISQSFRRKNPNKSTVEANLARATTYNSHIKNTLTSSLHSVPREEKEKKNLNKLIGEESPAGHPSPRTEIPNFRKAEHQSKKDDRRRKARQAWEADLVRQLGPEHHAKAIDMLANDPVLCDRATDAELREPGSGTTAAMIGMQRHLRGAA